MENFFLIPPDSVVVWHKHYISLLLTLFYWYYEETPLDPLWSTCRV